MILSKGREWERNKIMDLICYMPWVYRNIDLTDRYATRHSLFGLRKVERPTGMQLGITLFRSSLLMIREISEKYKGKISYLETSSGFYNNKERN